MIVDAEAGVPRALKRAREFLVAAQLPSGELPVEQTLRDAAGQPVGEQSESSPFITSFAALGLCADSSRASRDIRDRAVAFVESQREWPDVWRFWGRGAPLPADLDTTSVCHTLLSRHGRPARPIAWLYRRNRDRTGRFRTWLTPGNIRTLHPLYWLLMLGELRPSRAILVWRRTAAHRRDRDVVVNANVVTFLGDVPDTDGSIRWILDTVHSGEEETRDKWYRDREVLYLAVGRANARGVHRFAELAELIVERVSERMSASGHIAEDAIRTAMAASALLHLGRHDAVVERAVRWLVASQETDGGWPSAPLHYGSPVGGSSWGSRAVTTSLVVEALALFEAAHA